MISKISALNMQLQASSKVKNTTNTIENTSRNTTALNGAKYANTYKAYNNISFKGSELTPIEASIIGDAEIRIPNILDLTEDIDLSRSKMPKEKAALNALGLNVNITHENGKDTYRISNDKNDTLFIGRFDRSQPLPEITYKQGKYLPEITIKDESLGGKKVKMFSGSKIQGKNFELIMPGGYEPIPGGNKNEIKGQLSFTGHIYTSVLNKEERTKYAFEKWYNSDLPSHTIKGDYADEATQNDPNVVLLMGGFGERFRNITRDKENKPSAKLPTNDNYRIMASTLNLAASAGLLGQGTNDSINYLSQAHELTQDEIINGSLFAVDKYKTDGGAVSEALNRDIIRNDKDTIILNGDIFTNADISRVYHALKTLPNAGLVIPYYPVNPERAKSFGMLGVENDENGNIQIKSFIEKPKYTNKPPLPTDFTEQGEYDKAMEQFDKVQTALLPGTTDVFLANPGLYFMSKEASKVLMAMGLMDAMALGKEEGAHTGLGKDIMPLIVKMANEGKLKDSNGNNLKVYTVPLEAKGGKPAVWEDIGTAEAYLKVIKDVAAETSAHGTTSDNKYYGMPEFVLNDFKNNTDLYTGIVYGSNESREKFNAFKEKYGIGYNAFGNIFVTID